MKAARAGSALVTGWLAVSIIGLAGQSSRTSGLAIAEALSLYDRGEYGQFLEAIGREGAVDKRLFSTFERDASRWVKLADSDHLWRRSIVAASVAIEIAHLLRDQPADRAARYLAWASILMRKAPKGPSPETERLWFQASIAGMEELDEPWVLTVGDATPSSVLGPIGRSIGPGGHLAVALARFPDEPRFLLARVQASEWRLIAFELVPSYVDLARARASDRVLEDSKSREIDWTLFVRNQAATMLRARERLPDVVSDYESLLTHPSLRAEVELHWASFTVPP